MELLLLVILFCLLPIPATPYPSQNPQLSAFNQRNIFVDKGKMEKLSSTKLEVKQEMIPVGRRGGGGGHGGGHSGGHSVSGKGSHGDEAHSGHGHAALIPLYTAGAMNHHYINNNHHHHGANSGNLNSSGWTYLFCAVLASLVLLCLT